MTEEQMALYLEKKRLNSLPASERYAMYRGGWLIVTLTTFDDNGIERWTENDWSRNVEFIPGGGSAYVDAAKAYATIMRDAASALDQKFQET